MTAATLTGRRFTLRELHAIVRDEIKDRSYLATRLGPAVQDFLAWKRLSRAAERTLDQYERDLARLALAVPDKALEDVDVTDLMLLLDLIPEGSWTRFRAAWNGFFRWAQLFGRRPDNPCNQLPPLKRKTNAAIYSVFTADEQHALLAGCDKSLLPGLDYARVLTQLSTGARKGEATKLRLGSFNLAEQAVTLHGKGNKERIIPIPAELAHAIAELLTYELRTLDRPLTEDDYLWFPWRTVWMASTQTRRLKEVYPERPMLTRGFHEWWQRRIADAHVRYRNPHMTRHTYATNALDADANLYDVRDLMGHASTRTTEVYIHSSRKRLTRATDKLFAYRKQAED